MVVLEAPLFTYNLKDFRFIYGLELVWVMKDNFLTPNDKEFKNLPIDLNC